MKLIIVHYHLRPGGIRRVIELAAPHLVKNARRPVEAVILAVGEPPDEKWDAHFRRQLPGIRVELFLEPSFSYLPARTPEAAPIVKRLRSGLRTLFDSAGDADVVVWAHNLAVGRNLLLARELARECARRRVPLISHHHDWWFDNRWARWPEMRRSGFQTLAAVGRTLFPNSAWVRHVAINHSDAATLQRRFPNTSAWLPNLNVPEAAPSRKQVARTRQWLDGHPECQNRPIWILPCRLLRRKNIAEALLLQRWLRPEACLVTTGGVSSADEQPYFDQLSAAVCKHRWRVHLGILHGNEATKPGVRELLAASEAVLLTSIQEGFGLPFVEAAAAGRPLIARSIPNISPDLRRFGFRFPQAYDEILVAPRLFDWQAELERQTTRFEEWRRGLPGVLRRLVQPAAVMAAAEQPEPVPFSRLTLTAQLEILAQPVETSWTSCSPLNPFLSAWRKLASNQRLGVTPWPRSADHWLGSRAYARRFHSVMSMPLTRTRKTGVNAGPSIQMEFLREKLGAQWLFPLLWKTGT